MRGDPVSPARTGEIEVVGFATGLLDGAAALRSRVFGGTVELNREYLVWKYLRNPYLVEPLVHLALAGDEVVGMRGSMGTCWESQGNRYVLPHGGDVMVDERFRRQGITRLMQRAYMADLPVRGFRTAFSLSGGRMGTPAMVAGGWHVVVMLEALECLTGRLPPVVQRASERGHSLARRVLGARADNPLAGLTGGDDGQVQLVETGAAERLADIAALAPPSVRLRHVRDEEYFRWRLANPLSTYRVLASENAYVILQSNGGPANLVDWQAPDSQSLTAVLGVALRQLHAVRVWDLALDAGTRRALEHFGPVATARGPSASFTLRTVSDRPEDATLAGLSLDEPRSWDLRMLDSDEY